MHRTSLATRLAAALAIGTFTLAGCSQAGISANDAYKIGCPALDAVAASGSVVGKVALAGLEQLQGSGQVTGDTKVWLDTAIQYLKDPSKVPADSRKMIQDGCAANGYKLQNF